MVQRPFPRSLLVLLAAMPLTIMPFGCSQKQAEDTSNAAPAAPPGGKAPVTDGPANGTANKRQAAPARRRKSRQCPGAASPATCCQADSADDSLLPTDETAEPGLSGSAVSSVACIRVILEARTV